jgi:hypothetical protein
LFPFHDLLLFIVSGLVTDFGRGAGVSAVEEGPATSGLHCLLEAHHEDGPIQAIGLELGNIGGKLLNGDWGGHFQVIQSTMFVILDVGRAHNLW